MSLEELPIFIRWRKFLNWHLETTAKFPKRVRFTLSSRMDNLALDILTRIVEAAYTHDKRDILQRINLDLEVMRVLMRVCYEQRYLSSRSYEFAVKELYEVGRMVGGWMKSLKNR